MNKNEFRLRRIARIWSIVIIVFTLIMLIDCAVNWVKTGTVDPHAMKDYPPAENLIPPHFNLKCSGFGHCLALGGIRRSNQYRLLPGKRSGALLGNLSPTLSLSSSNIASHSWDIVPGMLVDIKKRLN